MTTNGLKDVRCTSQICRRNISVTVANKFAARLVLAWTLHIIENRIGIILIFPHSSPFLHDLQWHNLGQVALKKAPDNILLHSRGPHCVRLPSDWEMGRKISGLRLPVYYK